MASSPSFGLVAPVKAPRTWPKSSLSISVGHERSAIDGNERLVAEDARKVDGLGDQFLARAAFAENEHGMRALSGFGDDAVELFHIGRAPDEVAEALARLDGLAQDAVLRSSIRR